MASIAQCLNEVSDAATRRALQLLFEAVLADGQRYLTGSATWDAGSIADGDEEVKEVTVTGAALGDFVLASHGVDVADLAIVGSVTAANTVTVSLLNNTGGAIDLASTTVRVVVIPQAAYTATNLTA